MSFLNAFYIASAAFFFFIIFKAFRTGHTYFDGNQYSRDEKPVTFWSCFALYFAVFSALLAELIGYQIPSDIGNAILWFLFFSFGTFYLISFSRKRCAGFFTMEDDPHFYWTAIGLLGILTAFSLLMVADSIGKPLS